jgi:hypothetical protein
MAKGGKSAINTPFENHAYEKVPSHNSGNPGTFDKNRTPILSKPHAVGKDGISEKFYEGGKALEPNPEKFETPFNNTLYTAGSKKQGVPGLHAKKD